MDDDEPFDEDSQWNDEPVDFCLECDEPISLEEQDSSGLCPYCRNDP